MSTLIALLAALLDHACASHVGLDSPQRAVFPLLLIPLIAAAAAATAKVSYDAGEAPRRRRLAKETFKQRSLQDMLNDRARAGGAQTGAVEMQRGIRGEIRKINNTPAGNLPISTGDKPAFDPTMLLPIVQQGANIAGAAYDDSQRPPQKAPPVTFDTPATSPAAVQGRQDYLDTMNEPFSKKNAWRDT